MNAPIERTRKALLLENDPFTRAALAAALAARGFQVATASDGASGVAGLLDLLLDLDLLVSSVDLPGRGGADLLHLVRTSGGERDLPVVLTGHGVGSGQRARLLALGADAVADLADGVESAARTAAGATPARAAARPAPVDPWLPIPLPAPFPFRLPDRVPEPALSGLA
jgi:CheY-like chemotaxis protein